MLTSFQPRKILTFFTVFDVDGDGFIEQSDVERWAGAIAAVRGAGPGTPEHDDLHGLWVFTWAAREKVSSAGTERVRPREWVSLCDDLLSTEQGYATVRDAIGTRTYDVLDTDDDGELSIDDWRAFYRAIDAHEPAADEVFARLDADRDGHISPGNDGSPPRVLLPRRPAGARQLVLRAAGGRDPAAAAPALTNHVRPAAAAPPGRQLIARTFAACRPLGPCATS